MAKNYLVLLGALEKLRKMTVGFFNVCPQGTTPLPREEFLLNLIFEEFPKIVGRGSVLLKFSTHKGNFT